MENQPSRGVDDTHAASDNVHRPTNIWAPDEPACYNRRKNTIWQEVSCDLDFYISLYQMYFE